MKNHTRTKGYNEGSVTDDKDTYTMGQDRDIEFFIDRQDVDETHQELAMANISTSFITEHVQPELDSYRFSKMVKNTALMERFQQILLRSQYLIRNTSYFANTYF